MSATALDVFTCPLDGISLIEASAGTGKTWNICGLYLRLLLERKFEVQQILVVTFTNAATAELRDRIRSRIVETLDCVRGKGPTSGDPFSPFLLKVLRSSVHVITDQDMEERLQRALHNFDEAAIFTIHGFCHRALADTPFTAGVPMSAEPLADDTEMRIQVVHDFWRNHVASDHLTPELAAHLLGSKRNTPEDWGTLLKRQIAKPLSQVIWPPELDGPCHIDLDALASAHKATRALWQTDREAILACVQEAMPRLPANVYRPESVLTAASSWDELLAVEDALSIPNGLEKLDLLTTRRLKPKAKQAPPKPHAFFDQAATLLTLQESVTRVLALQRLRLLRQLLQEGPEQLRLAKRQQRVYAFDDMLQNVHERLTGGKAPWLATALRERFPAALIDEFQDTDPLQFAIFRQIYAGHQAPLFLVGDPKQAIYSFRGADLHTYLHARQEARCEYSLAENQRSTEDLLKGINALFEANTQAFMLPGLSYQHVHYGKKKRAVLTDNSVARGSLQLWKLPVDGDGTPLRKPYAQRAAARACAGEIARLLAAAQEKQITLDSRALSAGDIAVLVRSHKLATLMRTTLAEFGVGSVTQSQESIYDSQDSEELERVLLAVLEPSRERVLRAALATELMGMDAAQVEMISADEGRMLAFMSRFGEYRQLWLQRGVGIMLRQWMVREQVSERLLQRSDGQRRLTNLMHLAECLQEAAQEYPAPEALLRWLQLQRGEARSDDTLQLRLESDRHLVQILTIHKSKGLEYPIVFCPFLWDGHPGGPSESLDGQEYHNADGQPVIDFREDENDAVKEKIKFERAAEALRQLYVALTRAVHRCYIVVGQYGAAKGSPTEGCKSLLNWLVAGQGILPAQWIEAGAKAQEITVAWSNFAAAHAPQVCLDPLPEDKVPALQAFGPAAHMLQALAPPRRIPAGWRLGSYSSLSLGTRHEHSAADHDLRPAVRANPTEASTPPNADDILNFARGPAAGECLHTVFERANFTDPSTWPAAIAAALRTHPQGTQTAESAALLGRMLRGMLSNVMQTPLNPNIRLEQIARDRRLVELEFSLVVTHLSSSGLTAVMQKHDYPAPALAFGSLEGYLRGFIDLVFEHDGRFFILDWKSNYLGNTPEDYGPVPLEGAMREHGYHLQYLLYSIALHRYLAHRVPDYDFERHFGGVFYLFVRGVRPGWKNADGTSCGVFAHRPSRQTIESLAQELDRPREAA